MESPSSKTILLNIKPRIQSSLSNRRSVWLLLCGILFSWNTTLLWLAHTPDKYQCINLLLWLGILIALEDQRPLLWPRPSKASALVGSMILVAVVVRGSVITDPNDLFYLLLLPLLAAGLVLLNRPAQDLKIFRKPLAIASLFPVLFLIGHVISSVFGMKLANISAFSTWILLATIGFKPVLTGEKVFLGSGGIDVNIGCSGFDQIVFSLSIVLIFLLLFPLQKKLNVFAVLGLTVVVALLCNVVRLTLLAYFTSLKGQLGEVLFDFFHDSHGSLIFSLISASFVGYLYLLALDRELSAP
jgi:exosortase/archaeosortase family protein